MGMDWPVIRRLTDHDPQSDRPGSGILEVQPVRGRCKMFDVGVTRYLTVLWLSCVPIAAFAHHSLLSYDQSQIVEFAGEVTDVFWRNPHVRLTVQAVDEAGAEKIWRVEGASVNAMERAGFSEDFVSVGDSVRLVGHPSSLRDDDVQPVLLSLVNGPTIVLNESSATAFGLVDSSSDATSGDALAAVAAEDVEVDGIFRVWTNTGHWGRDVRGWWARDFPLNESARRELDAWVRETDDLAAKCLPAGLPEAMMQPFPIEFIDRGDTIVLNIEEWDNSRTIHMNADPEADVPHSRLGYSVGRWEGDTLVVETNRINYPYFNDQGIPQSEAVEIVERFTLSTDETRLDWAATLVDPGTFTEPVTMHDMHWEWIPANVIKPYDCVVDESQ